MRFLIAAATALLLALPAHGQNLEWSDFDISVGAQGQYRADYLGSDNYEFGFVPRGEIAWQKTLFVSTKNGAGVYIAKDDHSTFGVSVSPDFGRDESDNDLLAGLGDIGFGWRANIFGEMYYAPFVAGAKASVALGGDAQGQVVNAYIGMREELTERITGSMTLGATWAGRTWGRAYYGINATQAVASGLAQHDVDSGFRDVALGGQVSYRLTEKFSLTGSARWTHLMGDVADSPIVEDENNLTIGIGLGYQFATSAPRTNRY